jgi:thiol-disulfide isomerase/thioredoxin
MLWAPRRREVRRFQRFWLLWLLLLPVAVVAATPDLRLRDIDGQSHHVSEYIGRGQWTVVAVWSVDCVICQRELPEIAFFHDAHKHKKAIVLGLAVDGFTDRERVKKFIDDNALGFPNLIAERADVAQFGGGPLKGTPTYLIFSPKGELIARRVGATTVTEIERVIALGRDSVAPSAPR